MFIDQLMKVFQGLTVIIEKFWVLFFVAFIRSSLIMEY